MTYNQAPSIVSVTPARYETNVPNDTVITVEFSIDMDKATFGDSVHLYDANGLPVEIRSSYDASSRTFTITPRRMLNNLETYRMVVHGDNNPVGDRKIGARSVMGVYMSGDYDWTFTTRDILGTAERISGGTPNDVVINTQPTLKFTVSNATGADTTSVQIQVSRHKYFENVIWNCNSTPDEGISGVSIGVYLLDGTYYWRARISDIGVWSDTYTFNINTIPRSTIVDDDTIPLDPAFPSDWGVSDIDVTTVSPTDNSTGVPLNTKCISVTLSGHIPEEDIRESSIYLTADSNEYSNVSGYNPNLSLDNIIDVVYNKYNDTTTIILSLSPILEDSVVQDYEYSIEAEFGIERLDYEHEPIPARFAIRPVEDIYTIQAGAAVKKLT